MDSAGAGVETLPFLQFFAGFLLSSTNHTTRSGHYLAVPAARHFTLSIARKA
ncbi:MAG: hypothetical protein ACI9MB_004936, partial [Verrucomicrobiales bacterium]